MDSLKKQIENIMTENKGKIFSINDFYSLGTKNTIKSILYRLVKEEKITRLIDGLFTVPLYSDIVHEYAYPPINMVAYKLAEKFSWTISPVGNTALNYTGLSTQVPNNEYTYISDGAYRKYEYRGKTIIFKHTSNRNIKNYSKKLLLMIQAIKALGKDKIREIDIKRLASYSEGIEEELKSNTLKLPYWIQETLKKIQEVRI